ncbi:MAG: T9SS type A sorting domain-containing protein [Bacteroidota bacterium]
MKRLIIFHICTLIATISLGQDINHKKISPFESERIDFSENINFHNKIIGCSNYSQLKDISANSIFNAKQKLDSVIYMMNYEDINTWIQTSKREYLYDEYGNTTATIGYGWDDNINDWIPNNKTDKLFNEFNNPILEINNYWHIDSNQWISTDKYEYEYYEDSNIKLEKFTEKDYATNEWICKWKTEFNYNSNNQLQLKIYSTYVTDSNMSEAYRTEEFTYYSFGKLDTYLEKRLNHNTLLWTDMNKSIYTYNNNNQDSTILFLSLDYATYSLINDARIVNFYNSNGFDKIDQLSYWDKFENHWRFDSKEESNYDNYGKKIFLIRSRWYSDLEWHQINKREFGYDYNDNLSVYQFYSPTDSTNWLLRIEHDYNYDYNYTISECYFPTYVSYPVEYINQMNNKPTDFVILNEKDGELYEENRIIYHYSDLNTGVPESTDKNIEVYPNPTSGQLRLINENNIKLKEITIYNSSGQKVLQKNEVPNIMNLSSLDQGIYFIEFLTEKTVIRKKIIIKK